MKVEVLYFDGCPHHAATVARVREALRSMRHPAEIEIVEVHTQTQAEALGFLGSPSVRINGVDVEPTARDLKSFGLICRTYPDGAIRSGMPSRDLIWRAIAEQIERDDSGGAAGGIRRKGLLGALLGITVVLGGGLGRAQSTPAPDLTAATTTSRSAQLTGPVLERIRNIEEKMVAIAEDFPGDLYNTYRPKGNQDVRTAAEILLHVAGVNRRIGFNLRTKQQKDALFAAEKVPTSMTFPYVSKQDTASKVKESFEAVRKAIRDNPDPENLEGWLYVIAHSSEHYGNLVTYYRENGLVPPTSRQ